MDEAIYRKSHFKANFMRTENWFLATNYHAALECTDTLNGRSMTATI